jgi:hypothetical protein
LRVITLLVEEEGANPNGLLLEEVDAVEQTEWFIVGMKCILISIGIRAQLLITISSQLTKLCQM